MIDGRRTHKEQIETNNQRLERDVKRYKEREKHQERITILKKKRPWVVCYFHLSPLTFSNCYRQFDFLNISYSQIYQVLIIRTSVECGHIQTTIQTVYVSLPNRLKRMVCIIL